MHTQEKLETINKRYEKRETNREAKALVAAKLETAIEKELLSRLKSGTVYKDLYNLDEKAFEKHLEDEEQVDEDQQVFEEEFDDSDENDSLVDAILEEEGEYDIDNEMQSDLNDIENLEGKFEDKSGDSKSVLKKRSRKIAYEDEPEIEYEYEQEDTVKQKAKGKRAKVSASPSTNSRSSKQNISF